MKMDENHNFILTWLENSIFDVVVHNVHNLPTCGDEAQAVGVCLQIPLCFSPTKHRTHGKIRQPRHSLVFDSHKLFLFDKSGLFQFL